MARGVTHLSLLHQRQDSPCTQWRACAPLVFWLPFLLQRQDLYSHGVQQGTIFVAAKKGNPVGLIRQCEGNDLLVVVDNRGTPTGALDASAQQAEIKLEDLTLATVRVTRSRGRLRIRPKVKRTESG